MAAAVVGAALAVAASASVAGEALAFARRQALAVLGAGQGASSGSAVNATVAVLASAGAVVALAVAVAVVDAGHQVAAIASEARVRGLETEADTVGADAPLGAVHGAVLERAVNGAPARVANAVHDASGVVCHELAASGVAQTLGAVLASIAGVALACAVHDRAVVVAVDSLAVDTSKLSITHALAFNIIAVLRADALLAALALPADGAVADAVNTVTTLAALLEALGLLAVSTLIVGEALALAALVAAVAAAAQGIASGAGEAGGASAGAVVALALATAVVRASLGATVLGGPAIKANADTVSALAVGVAVGGACHHTALGASEGGDALALALGAHALVAAGTVDLLAALLDVRELVAARLAAIFTEETIVAHALHIHQRGKKER